MRERFFEILLGRARVALSGYRLGYGVRHVVDARHHLAVEETAVLLACLHQEGKRGKLLGTGVEVDAKEVAAQNVANALRATVAFLHINGIEQVEALVEDMTGATGKVGNGKLGKVVHLQRLATRWRINQILHVVLHLAIRIVVNIDAPHRVLHHIFHNPVWSEYLRGWGNLISIVLALFRKSLRLAVGDIELVKPADKFSRAKIIVLDKCRIVKHTHKATLRQNILWQKQLRVVCNIAKTLVDNRILMAVSHDEQGKLLVGFAVVVEQLHQFAAHVIRHLRHTSLSCLAHDDRYTHILTFVCQDRRYKTLLLHDADSHEAVEPSVGCLLCHLTDATGADVIV